MSRITVDFDVYPLIQITLHAALDADGVYGMYGALEELLQRRGHYVTVVDTTALPTMPDAVARRAGRGWRGQRRARVDVRARHGVLGCGGRVVA